MKPFIVMLFLLLTVDIGSTAENTRIPVRGIDYSPFRDGQRPGGPCPSIDEIREDMTILHEAGFRVIRTYGIFDCSIGEKTLMAANALGVKVIVGVWLAKNHTANNREITALKELASRHRNIQALTVGSEVLLRREMSSNALLTYIKEARRIASLPITTAEVWPLLVPGNPGYRDLSGLIDAVDFLTVNVFPSWDGVAIGRAVNHVQQIYEKLRLLYPRKPIVIGETGWPTAGLRNGDAVPSLQNQRRFLSELQHLDLPIYLFSAFDEKWKKEPAGVGPNWGIFYSDRKTKHPQVTFR
jgi:exo-beta-1,3-glucanase (GH17 family)